MRVVIALGGNALQRRGETLDARYLIDNIQRIAPLIAKVAANHELMIVHGNGPQVGLLALQADSYKEVAPYPLDILDAESQGMIGYLLQQKLGNNLHGRRIATLLTQVVVDPNDSAFDNPTKPIGPHYTEDEIRKLKRKKQWNFAKDGGSFRRVVPSPQPQRILELQAVETLLDEQFIVITGGGGGIPCIETGSGRHQGIEAVVDKDLTAALLAKETHTDCFIILTDVPNVYRNWGEPEPQPIKHTRPSDLRTLKFAPGSMAPKVEAACRFVENTGHDAFIGELSQLDRILNEKAGTRVSLKPSTVTST